MAVGYVDLVLDSLVKQGSARVIKSGKDKRHNGTYVNEYDIFVGDDALPVNVRLWFNNSKNCAEVKISPEGMELLADAATVIALMNRVGQHVNKNGHGLNVRELETVLKNTMTQLTGQEMNDLEIIL